ncbi:uncharacterized protein LOC107362513 [Tetranychus urticae]|uniref:BTB domain-containing protein n=1 Tax=Tetranychus urticae TaxID=32264 RepID=T1KBC4_TETUR|nr:uncharacterized protein LOC107362513 [Tetranychus urticae]
MAFSVSSSAHHQSIKASPRKRTALSSVSSIVNDAFQAKCVKELNKLRSNCRKTLQQDLTRLLDKETFADTFIEGDTFRKPCHSCLLASRVPTFYLLLINHFDFTSSKHSKRGFNTYRLPSTIDCKEITDFLQKVYCHEDICFDESLIVDKLRAHISITMTSESGIDKKSVSSVDEDNLSNGLIKEDSLEDFVRACNGGFDKDSLKPSDSLELVTDSLNNASISSEDNKNERHSTDYEDSLAAGQKDEGLTSSESSQMVRSGTYDMLTSIQLEDHILKNLDDDDGEEKNNEKDSNHCESQILIGNQAFQGEKSSSETNLRHRLDSLELNLNSTKEESTKDSLDDDNDEAATDADVATPVAEVPESLTTQSKVSRSQSSSLFQFFVDMDSMSRSTPNCDSSRDTKKEEINMTSSGFMFIDLNSVGPEEEQKSRTIERDKNKVKDKRVPKIDPADGEEIKSSSSLSMRHGSTLEARSRTNRGCESNDENNSGRISNNTNSRRSVNYRKQASSSSVLGNNRHSFNKSRPKNINRQSTSPMSSMDSGMLSSINSECTHGDDEDWLLSIKTHSQVKKGASLWRNETQEDQQSTPSMNHAAQHRKNTSEVNMFINKDDKHSRPSGSRDDEHRRTINSCSKLGEDLLQMYYNGINADITIKAENRTLKAHKCILVARSPYFSAMFSGEWRDSKTTNITLQGFSYITVHFALCHIYSGGLNIPTDDNFNLAELALLSNLLALDTLRDVVIYELEKTYCHFFHKPCSECTVGVVDCLIVSSECGFSTLHQKCLTWSGKHFARLWPTRSFACLPNSLLDSCFQSTIHSMTPKSIIEIVLHCDRLTKTTPKVKWAEPIFSLIGRLIEQCVNFVAGNYDLIVASESFISLGRANSWNISALEETFLAAMNNMTPEIACKTLVKLNNIISIAENEEAFGYGPYAESYVALVRKMYRHCERFLVNNVNVAVTVPSWSLLPAEVQQKIKDSAIIVFEFDKPLAPRPQLSSSQLQSLRKKRSPENSDPSKSSSTSNKSVHKSKQRSNETRNKMSLTRSATDHIYDEVSFEPGEFESGATSLPLATMHDRYRSHRIGRRSRDGQESNVDPHSDRRSDDMCEDLGEISSSTNEKYQDQEMSRKKQDKNRRSPQSTSALYNNSFRPSSRTRTSSSSSATRTLTSRPPFK